MSKVLRRAGLLFQFRASGLGAYRFWSGEFWVCGCWIVCKVLDHSFHLDLNTHLRILNSQHLAPSLPGSALPRTFWNEFGRPATSVHGVACFPAKRCGFSEHSGPGPPLCGTGRAEGSKPLYLGGVGGGGWQNAQRTTIHVYMCVCIYVLYMCTYV